MERLKKDGQIWVLPAAEKGQMMLFPRETDPNLAVSQDIRKAWLSVEVSSAKLFCPKISLFHLAKPLDVWVMYMFFALRHLFQELLIGILRLGMRI